MSLLDRAEELKDIPDAQLAQLVKQGSEAGDTWLAATETQRRQDMRKRYAAEAAKQQAANPPSVLEQRAAELGGGIPSADPNMQGPDPSLQTGIATAAGGGLIRGYQNGGEIDDRYTQIGLEEMLDSGDRISAAFLTPYWRRVIVLGLWLPAGISVRLIWRDWVEQLLPTRSLVLRGKLR